MKLYETLTTLVGTHPNNLFQTIEKVELPAILYWHNKEPHHTEHYSNKTCYLCRIISACLCGNRIRV